MHRIDGPGATVDNKFTDGDPVGGIQATLVTDDWLNDVQEELLSILTAGGVTPVKGTQDQVLKALRFLSSPHGQCRLTKSGANIVLSRFGGNKLIINGISQVIPAAGVSLAATGLTPSTLYYIYAYMNAGVMTLEASATGHSTDAASGVEIKTGDATRTLVGMARPITGPAWQDSTQQRFVCSWFNRIELASKGVFAANFSTTSITYVELSATVRCEFLAWPEDLVNVNLNGSVGSSIAGSSVNYAGISFDGGSVEDGANISSSTSINFTVPANPSVKRTLSEGYHYATVMAKTLSGNTLTMIGAASSPDRATLYASFRG